MPPSFQSFLLCTVHKSFIVPQATFQRDKGFILSMATMLLVFQTWYQSTVQTLACQSEAGTDGKVYKWGLGGGGLSVSVGEKKKKHHLGNLWCDTFYFIFFTFLKELYIFDSERWKRTNGLIDGTCNQSTYGYLFSNSPINIFTHPIYLYIQPSIQHTIHQIHAYI